VKYHHGAEGRLQDHHRKEVAVTLSPNPSHLEAVIRSSKAGHVPTRRQAEHRGTARREHRAPVLLHGDAASRTGRVARPSTWRGSRDTRPGARSISFSTIRSLHDGPREGRSTDYSSDLAKGFDAPIIHVNADDPEACLAAVRLAMLYRAKFHGDVVIDVVGYRR